MTENQSSIPAIPWSGKHVSVIDIKSTSRFTCRSKANEWIIHHIVTTSLHLLPTILIHLSIRPSIYPPRHPSTHPPINPHDSFSKRQSILWSSQKRSQFPQSSFHPPITQSTAHPLMDASPTSAIRYPYTNLHVHALDVSCCTNTWDPELPLQIRQCNTHPWLVAPT